jgi:hypothetical protein
MRRVPGSILAGLSQLSQLTALKLHGHWSSVGEPLHHILAQPLPLRQLHLELPLQRLPPLNLAHLTQLEEVNARGCKLSEGSLMPAQLQHLSFDIWLSAPSIQPALGLQQLQSL